MMAESPETIIKRFTVNLTDQVRQNPQHYLAPQRANELRATRTILNQDRKNSVAIIGEAGVGKTAIVEALAAELLLEERSHDALSDRTIVTLTLPNLMQASQEGSFATNLQNLIDALIEKKEHYILFIDEMHQLIGTGSSEGSMMDAANILKPAIGRGQIHVIGATTLTEYHQSIEVDGAMDRRFDKVTVAETTPDQTMAILQQVAAEYAQLKHVQTAKSELAFIYKTADRYMTTQYFPEKAIMLLDSATTIAQIAGAETLDRSHIAQKIHASFKVPLDVLLENDSDRILNLPVVLRKRVIGQEKALKKMERYIRARSAGLGDLSKPMSFMLAGPTGVGKTETAKALAQALFGSDNAIIRFDMSEFKYAERSAGLFQERLTEAVKYQPYAVLLLDEVEKADPLVLDLLLQVLDDGRLSNDLGRTVNFKDLLIIMTTNLGHKEIAEFHANAHAFKNDRKHIKTFMANFESVLRGSGMRREFVKRISATIIYEPLSEAAVLQIIDLKLQKLQQKATQKGYTVLVTKEEISALIPSFKQQYEQVKGQRIPSYPINQFLMDKGYASTDGARPLDDAINEYLTDVLAEAVIQERLTGQSDGHTFIFRARGQAPDAQHSFGTWVSIYTQFENKHATQKEG